MTDQLLSWWWEGQGFGGEGRLSKDRRLLEQKDLFREMQTCCAWSRGAEQGGRRPKSRQRPDGGGKLSQGAAALCRKVLGVPENVSQE